MERIARGSVLTLLAALALGGASRACSPAADTAQGTVADEGAGDAGTWAVPFVTGLPARAWNKPVPQTPNAEPVPHVVADAAVLGVARDPPPSAPADPPPPPEARP